MKILLTTDTYQPYISGVVISTYNLYKELKALGHDVRILTLSDDGKEKIDGDIYCLKSFDLKIYPGVKFKKPFNTEVGKALLKWKPDIIHSQTEFSTMINAKHIASKLKIPQVHTYHTMYEDYLDYILNGKVITPKTMAIFVKLLLNRFNRVIAPTVKVEKALRGYGVKVPIDIIPTGIDLSKFQKSITEEEKIKLRDKCGLSPDDNVLVFLGRVAQEKNIDEIIDMFSRLESEMDKLKFLIVGKGPYLDELMTLVKNKNLEDKIHFTGMVDPNDVYKYYKISDAFVTGSTSETQGLTYIEALSSGLPVICRYDTCIEGVVETDENGFVYNNEEEFRKAVKSLFSNDEYRYKIAQNAELAADKFSAETFGKKAEQLYKSVLDESRVLSTQSQYSA
ncbi:glycosyltransferase family 4 protein [Clostridium ganghwense]|uniref:Glycosyltransferase family 4 protein n=1 Tax=Clostridium ganghwense TaxID=312089 RepID=A0ABT4CMC3_9CLOT|nr:glycosyltransferase family 4 protein [Clostridium ganghwense]MCY6370205.1 glycosyltransferase family 4 protein [Clostridium ganghwense]